MKHRARFCCVEDVSDESAALFIRSLFDRYAMEFMGKPLMQRSGLLSFFRDFAGGSPYEPRAERLEQLYAEELELQADTRFRFSLSRAESSKGICYQTFQILLEKALPFNVAITLAKEKYIEYSQGAYAAEGGDPLLGLPSSQ